MDSFAKYQPQEEWASSTKIAPKAIDLFAKQHNFLPCTIKSNAPNTGPKWLCLPSSANHGLFLPSATKSNGAVCQALPSPGQSPSRKK